MPTPITPNSFDSSPQEISKLDICTLELISKRSREVLDEQLKTPKDVAYKISILLAASLALVSIGVGFLSSDKPKLFITVLSVFLLCLICYATYNLIWVLRTKELGAGIHVNQYELMVPLEYMEAIKIDIATNKLAFIENQPIVLQMNKKLNSSVIVLAASWLLTFALIIFHTTARL